MRSAPETFARKAEAQRYLTLVESQIARGEWTDPERAKVTLGDYAERWIAERPGLRPRTVELYRWLLRRHIAPWLGGVPLGKIDTPLVREWRAKLLTEGVSLTMAAKSYRLLRSVLMTAVNEDRIIPRNPCQVRGADKEQPRERGVPIGGRGRRPGRCGPGPLSGDDPSDHVREPAVRGSDRTGTERRRPGGRHGAGASGLRGGARQGPCGRPRRSRVPACGRWASRVWWST